MKNDGENATVKDITEALQILEIDSSAKAIEENKLTDALHGLGITDKCQSFVIDGDLAVRKDTIYFQQEAFRRPFGKMILKLCWLESDCLRRVPINSCRMTC